jgi:rsbT antagonist protein RsbS
MVTMPPDPDDATIRALQEKALASMERHDARVLVLDITAVDTVDSYFARTISETAQMVSLMGGRTVVAGMQPAVAVTATQLGLAFRRVETALSVDRALDLVSAPGERGRWR